MRLFFCFSTRLLISDSSVSQYLQSYKTQFLSSLLNQMAGDEGEGGKTNTVTWLSTLLMHSRQSRLVTGRGSAQVGTIPSLPAALEGDRWDLNGKGSKAGDTQAKAPSSPEQTLALHKPS